MTTTYALLLDRCGLSHREAAEFHGVRLDTVKSWSAGRNGVPPGAIEELRALYAKIERAAAEAVALIRAQAAEDVELGLARDDAEARSLGWPCIGAQAASLGLAAALTIASVRIVPRGATAATAAAVSARAPLEAANIKALADGRDAACWRIADAGGAEYLAARTTDGLRAELGALDKKISNGRASEGHWNLAKVIEAEIIRRARMLQLHGIPDDFRS